MARPCSRAPKGWRLTAHVPHGHWKPLISLAGLRPDRIVAPFLPDGPIDGEAFTARVGQCLAPAPPPGDIVIADNLGSHRGLPARQSSALLFRCSCKAPPALSDPSNPCSPDLNPIKVAWCRVGTLRDTFPPAECRNSLRHAGRRDHAPACLADLGARGPGSAAARCGASPPRPVVRERPTPRPGQAGPTSPAAAPAGEATSTGPSRDGLCSWTGPG